jgi:putative membrane protein
MTPPPSPDAETVFAITRPSPRLLTLYVLRCIALCFLGPWFLIALVPLYFRYHTLRYRFDDEGVAMSWGVLWRRETYLTYARIQDIHISRGLFERWLGLGTIQVQTAAGSAGAEMGIEGLAEYELVRDYLYSRMRGATLHAPSEAGSAHADDAAQLLTDIRDELRALRRELESKRA